MSLRAALARKAARETHYDVLVVSSEEQEQLEEAFAVARRAVGRAVAKDGEESPAATDARAELEAAREALTGASCRIRFHPLDPDAFEALVGDHPPTKAQQDEGDQWDRTTFAPALLAACAVDSDMTEKDWTDELTSKDERGRPKWSRADRDGVFMAALTANVIPRSVTVPKG